MLKTRNKTEDANQTSLDSIRGKGLYFLGRREYSRFELEQKLREKFPGSEKEIAEIIEEFTLKGWISDQRYTEEMVREKSVYARWGPQKITQQLRGKGIEKEMIVSVLEILFPETMQQEVALRLAKEKWKTLHKKTAPEKKAAVQRFLVSRGFLFSTIISCMEIFTQEEALLEDPSQACDSKTR